MYGRFSLGHDSDDSGSSETPRRSSRLASALVSPASTRALAEQGSSQNTTFLKRRPRDRTPIWRCEPNNIGGVVKQEDDGTGSRRGSVVGEVQASESGNAAAKEGAESVNATDAAHTDSNTPEVQAQAAAGTDIFDFFVETANQKSPKGVQSRPEQQAGLRPRSPHASNIRAQSDIAKQMPKSATNTYQHVTGSRFYLKRLSDSVLDQDPRDGESAKRKKKEEDDFGRQSPVAGSSADTAGTSGGGLKIRLSAAAGCSGTTANGKDSNVLRGLLKKESVLQTPTKHGRRVRFENPENSDSSGEPEPVTTRKKVRRHKRRSSSSRSELTEAGDVTATVPATIKVFASLDTAIRSALSIEDKEQRYHRFWKLQSELIQRMNRLSVLMAP